MMRRTIKLGLLLAAAGAVTGCATQQDLQLVNQRIVALENQAGGFHKQVVDLQARDEDLGKRVVAAVDLIKLESSTLGKRIDEMSSDTGGLRKSFADIQADKDSVRVDMQTLAGTVDDHGNAIKKLSEEMAFSRDELTRQIAAAVERGEKLDAELVKLRKQIGDAANAKVAGVESDPAALFNRANKELADGQTSEAQASFELFREKYPRHPLMVEALLHIGQIQAKNGKHEEAILALQDIVKDHPDSKFRPAAMLLQAQSFVALKDVTSAKYIARQIVENYPNSPEAAPALAIADKDKIKNAKTAPAKK